MEYFEVSIAACPVKCREAVPEQSVVGSVRGNDMPLGRVVSKGARKAPWAHSICKVGRWSWRAEVSGSGGCRGKQIFPLTRD